MGRVWVGYAYPLPVHLQNERKSGTNNYMGNSWQFVFNAPTIPHVIDHKSPVAILHLDDFVIVYIVLCDKLYVIHPGGKCGDIHLAAGDGHHHLPPLR